MIFGPSSDHDEIRAWAALHHAKPALVRVAAFDSEPAKLHFLFGEVAEKDHPELRVISWDAFFALFDQLCLVLVSTGEPGATRFELLRRERRKSGLYKDGENSD